MGAGVGEEPGELAATEPRSTKGREDPDFKIGALSLAEEPPPKEVKDDAPVPLVTKRCFTKCMCLYDGRSDALRGNDAQRALNITLPKHSKNPEAQYRQRNANG